MVKKNLAPRMSFAMKQFVNITSGTLVDSAIWKVGYDIEEVEVSESNQILIDSVLKKKRTKDFITRLS
jgi:hypothetical protein